MSPFGVMMPGWYCSGVMLQSDQFCRLTKTSLRRRTTCFSYCDGTPYSVAGIGLPSVLLVAGTGSDWAIAAALATAPAATPVPTATDRLRNLRRSWDSNWASSSGETSFFFVIERARVTDDLSDMAPPPGRSGRAELCVLWPQTTPL